MQIKCIAECPKNKGICCSICDEDCVYKCDVYEFIKSGCPNAALVKDDEGEG